MASFNLSIVKCAFDFISKMSNEKVPTKQILEPFSTIIKLAICSFSEEGTKLAVYNNKLFIQPPNLLQGTVRMAYGNNREEVHHLLRPIMMAIDLYPPEKNDELKSIYHLAMKGLKLIKKSYNNGSSTVNYTLDLYISIIDRKLLDKSIYIDSFDGMKDDKETTELFVHYTNIFKDLWDESDISLIFNMFKSITKSKDIAISENYIVSIESLIKAKEHQIEEKIKKSQLL